ncbi:hypothetical protein C8Q76DRAFT_26924 [Earliella scabrosa]|nr:hypothetical protein C8Q76DRAFT_26924 [Earliella scabrosa]
MAFAGLVQSMHASRLGMPFPTRRVVRLPSGAGRRPETVNVLLCTIVIHRTSGDRGQTWFASSRIWQAATRPFSPPAKGSPANFLRVLGTTPNGGPRSTRGRAHIDQSGGPISYRAPSSSRLSPQILDGAWPPPVTSQLESASPPWRPSRIALPAPLKLEVGSFMWTQSTHIHIRKRIRSSLLASVQRAALRAGGPFPPWTARSVAMPRKGERLATLSLRVPTSSLSRTPPGPSSPCGAGARSWELRFSAGDPQPY